MNRLLIVDEDTTFHATLAEALQKKGYQVDSLYDGKLATEAILSGQYDLVLLAWVLPNKEGVSIIEEVRSQGYIRPVLLVTMKNLQEDIIQGLQSGADDYITKPFTLEIVLARIDAHIRRYHKYFTRSLSFLDITMNLDTHEVFVLDQLISLTKVEYDVLKLFLENPKQVLSRQEILTHIWNFNYDGDTRLVDIHVFKLKKKLDGSMARFKSIRGVGYTLIAQEKKEEY